MKITKFVHSCLLVEDGDYTAIIDPGMYSWESGLFAIETLTRLDDIIITHQHADHMYMPFIEELVEKFPLARITTNPAVADLLHEAGVKSGTLSQGKVQLFEAAHETVEALWPTPANIGVHLADTLTHPGDSHHIDAAKRVFALPITAPWGSMIDAANLGVRLKPEFIIPIHDWHWNDMARTRAYEDLARFFAGHSIHFVQAQSGIPFEV